MKKKRYVDFGSMPSRFLPNRAKEIKIIEYSGLEPDEQKVKEMEEGSICQTK